MIIKLAKAVVTDYIPKLAVFFKEREERNKELYAIGVQSGEAINQLREDFQAFEDRQFDVFLQMLAIIEETEKALEDVDKGTDLHKSTGLPRSIGDPDLRREVKHYFDLMQVC